MTGMLIHNAAADEAIVFVHEMLANIRERPDMSYRSPGEAQACGATALLILGRLLALPWESVHDAVRPVMCDDCSVNVVAANDWADAATRIKRGMHRLLMLRRERDEAVRSRPFFGDR